MATRKSNRTIRISKANGRPAVQAIRDRFETGLGDVRTRFRSFERDWSKTVDRLVSRGRNAEKDLRKRLDKVGKAVRGLDYEKAFKNLRREVKGIQGEVGEFFQASASRVKNVIDLPTRTDFERLNKKIEQLSSHVRSLESKRKRA